MSGVPEKLLVIGLDGADLDLVRPWMDAGDLPNLAEIAAAGAAGVLRSTIPPVSSPAWACFMTGRNPGRHGCFGFVTERPGTGETSLVSLRTIRGTKLWDAFNAGGRKVAVMNVPITYPTPEVDGVFVAGMLTPPGRPFTWPPEFQDALLAAAPDYRIDIDRGLFDDRARFAEHLHSMVAARGAAARRMLGAVDWALGVVVFTNTDRVQHHYWRKEKDAIRDLYRRIDGEIGRILETVDRDRTLVMVLSDHGFTDTDRTLYLNRWLRAEGYLAVRRVAEETDDYESRRFNRLLGEPEEVRRKTSVGSRIRGFLGLGRGTAIDWSRTRAYVHSADTRGIHVNLEGRQPMGIVPEGEYEALRDEIVGRLRALEWPETGEPVFDLVAKREDLYDGPYVDSAPDILTVPERERYRVVTKVDGKRWYRQHGIPDGYHRVEGLLFAAGPGVRAGAAPADAGIADVMPTLLFAAGLPIPERADGRVLREILDDDLLAAREERRVPEADDAPEGAVDLSAEEDRLLRETLEGLGYL